MCGLVGVIGDISEKQKTIFKTMLEFDTRRGPHSTGVSWVNLNGDSFVDKDIGTPWDLYSSSEVLKNDFNLGLRYVIKGLIGHNRWATKGHITVGNAHPFVTSNIIGMHNGTISWSGMEFFKNKNITSEVDSEMLINSIDKHGLEETIHNMTGAWSIVYYDIKAGAYHFLRNKERPMYMAFSKDNKKLFFGSEPWMIKVSCEMYKEEIKKIFSTEEDVHYSVDVSSKNLVREPLILKKENKKVEGKKFITTVITTNYMSLEKDQAIIDETICNDGTTAAQYIQEDDSKYGNNHTLILRTLYGDRLVRVYSFLGPNGIENFRKKAQKQTCFYSFVPKTVIKINNEDGLQTYTDSLTEHAWTELEEDQEEDTQEYIKFGGDYHTQKEVGEILNWGCCVCGTTYVDQKDYDKIKLIDEPKVWICPDCENITPFPTK